MCVQLHIHFRKEKDNLTQTNLFKVSQQSHYQIIQYNVRINT